MKKVLIILLLLLAFAAGSKAQPYTVGSGGTYNTLYDAFFDINNGNITGDIELQIISNITETGSPELFASGYGGISSYSSVLIYPTVSGYKIDANLNSAFIILNGATNVTIDGRVNHTGSTADLIITNISTGSSASTIEFIESAQNNTVKYCSIMGASTSTAGGVIFFSTSSTGTGNSSNSIDNNNITSDPAGRPLNVIYSAGTAGRENSSISISSNNINNFINAGTSSYGIQLSSNTTSSTIQGNSFYESAPFAPSANVTYNIILINNTGIGFTVSGNYIGGRSASCGGSAWTKTNTASNTFIGISINAGTGSASNIQGNTINNFDWVNASSTTSPWTGISVSGGMVNIGTSTANTIGATTGTGSILVTGYSSGTTITGINITGSGTVDCEYNTIGAVTAATSSNSNASNFTGIIKSGTAGTTTISNNLIGSTSTSGSIIASSTSTASVQNIIAISNAGSGTISIVNNTIANITNSSANSGTSSRGRMVGILSSAGTLTLSGNSIHDLTIANANDASNQSASVCGLALYGNTADKTIAGNTIYNLSNTYSSFTGSVVGIYFVGSTGTNNVTRNFIHSLSVSSSSTAAFLYGINISSGATTYSNNIISLGGTTQTTIYGIYETGAAGNNNNLYFNTIYIGGTPSSGTNKSFALYSAVNTNSRNFRNNIFVNARSTSGGSYLHYSMYIVTTGGTITCDYNNYFVSGTGGYLGYYGGNAGTVPIVTGQDSNSTNSDPVFAGTGTSATDYKPSASLPAVTGTGITIDYSSATRGVSPTMGAWEMLINMWKGSTSTSWGIASNWTGNVVPSADANIIFDPSPTRDCYLDMDRSVTNITNTQGTYNLFTNGFKLTIKGSIVFSGGAKIDASSGIVEFAGPSTQDIPSGTFVSNTVNNLTINNGSNVNLNGTLNITGTLTTTAGQLNSYSNSPTLGFTGSSAQTIGSGQLVSNRVYNLTISNSAGVALNCDLTVDNTLTVSAGILTIGTSKTLTLKGTLSLTGQIDASTNSPTLVFAGTSAQSIPSGAFSNSNKVYNLTINNSNNVSLNGTMNITGTFLNPSGKLDATSSSSTLWLGSTSAQTLNASQFVSSKVYNLVIDNSAGVTQNSDFTIDNNLTINSGKIFAISAGNTLTVTGTLANSAGTTGLVIRSVSNGNDGKLINNTPGVSATVEMAYTGGLISSARVYHYFVPPVASMSFRNTSVYNCGVDLGLSSFTGDLLNYSESDAGATMDNGWNFFDGWPIPPRNPTTAFSSLSSTMGYNINSSGNDKITFTGTLNNSGSAHTFGPLSFTSLGWNLVGNPYPCNYDIAGISLLTGTGDGVDNTVYFNHDGGYAFWNVDLGTGTTGFSSIMPPMQGFFVHVTSTGKTLSLPITSKTSSTALPLRSKGYHIVKKLKMVLNNGAVPDEAIVCLLDDATSGFDSDYDAYKLFGNVAAAPYIYTESSSVKYALNSIKDPGSATVIVPVTVVLKSAGTYKIDISEFDNLDGYNVILRHGSDQTILSKNSSYTFTSGAGTFTDFQLIFGNIITATENITPETIKTWYSNNNLFINCPSEIPSGKTRLEIYNIQGKKMYENNSVYLSPGQQTEFPISLPYGVYIIHIEGLRQPYVSKFVVY